MLREARKEEDEGVEKDRSLGTGDDPGCM